MSVSNEGNPISKGDAQEISEEDRRAALGFEDVGVP